MLKTALTAVVSAILAAVAVTSLAPAPETATVDVSGIEAKVREQGKEISALRKRLALVEKPVEGVASSRVDTPLASAATREEVEAILNRIVEEKKEEIAEAVAPKVKLPVASGVSSYKQPDEETRKKWREQSAQRIADYLASRGLRDIEVLDWQKEKLNEIFKDYALKRSELYSDRDLSREERDTKQDTLREERNKAVQGILTPDQYTTYTKNIDSHNSRWRR